MFWGQAVLVILVIIVKGVCPRLFSLKSFVLAKKSGFFKMDTENRHALVRFIINEETIYLFCFIWKCIKTCLKTGPFLEIIQPLDPLNKSLLATTVVFTLENYLNLVSKSQKLAGTNVLQNGLLTNGLHNQSNKEALTEN